MTIELNARKLRAWCCNHTLCAGMCDNAFPPSQQPNNDTKYTTEAQSVQQAQGSCPSILYILWLMWNTVATSIGEQMSTYNTAWLQVQ